MIPGGWREAKIREVAKIDVGRDLVEERFARTISNTHRFPIYSNTVEQHGHYGFYDFPEYSAESVTVVGRGIGLGTAFARKTPFGAIGRLLVLSPKDDSFDVGYLADYLNHGFEIHYESDGIPQLPGKTLGNYSILLPPLPEQRRIAEILSTWDCAIETVEALIANARAQKKALMQSLLTGKHRLPGFSEDWETTMLENVAQVIVSNVDKKSGEGEQPVRLCNYMDVYRADRIEADMPFMRATAAAAQIRKFGLRIGDVLITKDSETPEDIAVPSYVASTAPDLVCGHHLAIIRAKPETDGQFLKYYFEQPTTQHFFASRANGATRFGLTIGAIEGAPIILPSLPEQQRIGEAIAIAELEMHRLMPIAETLRQEKSALMQQLLTGKRRVRVDLETEA